MVTSRNRLFMRGGQSTVEYMLVVSVLVIAMWSAAQHFVPGWKGGLRRATSDIQNMTSSGYVGGGSGGR